MPKIPTYTAEGTSTRQRQVDFSGAANKYTAIGEAAKSVEGLTNTAASIVGRLQAQADESTAIERLAIFANRENQIRMSLFQADPNDPTAKIPSVAEAETLYQEQMRSLSTEIEAGASGGAVRLMRGKIAQYASESMIKTRELIYKRGVVVEKARLARLGDTLSQFTPDDVPFELAYDMYLSEYQGNLARAQARGLIDDKEALEMERVFKTNALSRQADRLIEDPISREEFFAKDERGDWNAIEPEALKQKRAHAGVLVKQEEEAGRLRHERMMKQQNDMIRVKIGTLVATGRVELAQIELDNAVAKRYLTEPVTIEHLRSSIAQGPMERASTRSVLADFQLDAESINPRKTLDDVDRSYAQYMQTGIGLNLKDATAVKAKLQQTTLLKENKANERLIRDHNQAEELLRAGVNIPRGIMLTALGDDPRVRIYYGLLAQLTARSPLYNPDSRESVLKVATELSEQARKNMGSMAQLKLSEIPAVYKTPTELEKANAAGLIDPDSYQAQKRIWQHEMDPQMRQEIIEYYQRKSMDPTYTSPTDPERAQNKPQSGGREKSGTIIK